MKKYLLIFSFAIITIATKAAVHIIQVSNFQFSPSTVNAAVGDTIHWVWVSGFHTTTSTSVPAGAATWNANLQGAGQTFDYVPTVAGTYNYWCAIHTTAMEGVLNVTGSLPVTLSSFILGNGKNNAVLLNWQTSTETNTAYFSVRRSYDGNHFSEIGKVTAAGNSSTEKNYSYSDENFSKSYKYIYYMLAIIDKDGSTQFSPIKLFINNTATSKLITQISPNPVKNGEHLMLQFNADKAGDMLVQVYDTKGKLVQQEDMQAYEGLNNGHLHLANIAAGTYNIIFTLNNIKETYKIVVQ